MKHLLARSAALVLLPVSLVSLSPAQAEAPLCDGRPVTLAAAADGSTVVGTEGPDVIDTAGFRRITVLGNGGDDVICAQTGAHAVLDGGAGSDRFLGGPHARITYADSSVGVTIDLEAGTVDDGTGTDTVVGIHHVIGSPFRDSFIGTDGDDRYESRGVPSYGGLTVPVVLDVVVMGAGDDTVSLMSEGRPDIGGQVDAGPGDDLVTASGSVVDAGPGDDVVRYHGGGTVRGGPGADHLRAYQWYRLVPSGYRGEVRLDGGPGPDTLLPPRSLGHEHGLCPCPPSHMVGGPGIDTLAAHALLLPDSRSGTTVDLATGRYAHRGDGGTVRSVENVDGSRFDDVIRGDGGANRLAGGRGDDVLIGRAGRDTVDGGPGRDVCVAEVRRAC